MRQRIPGVPDSGKIMGMFEYTSSQSEPFSKTVPVLQQKLLFGYKARGSTKGTDIRTPLTYYRILVSILVNYILFELK